ncbi:ABC transporter permease subunit [Halobacillus fulvus]|nr:ABC transporter permease subunit [Halobacillus fulvus]
MKAIKLIVYYLLGLFGILLISATPSLFRSGSLFDISSYLEECAQLFFQVVTPSEWVYLYKGNPEPLFPFLWDSYQYSMVVFVGGIMAGLTLAFLLALGTMFLPKWAKEIVTRLLDFLESVPDLLLAFMLQLFVVWFFKQTDILLFDFAQVGTDRIYILPILAISVLPMIMMYKIILMLMEEEMMKQYVQMARGKGLEKAFILNVHVLRNIGKSVFHHSKIIIWTALSSLFIFEYIFNMNGVTNAFIGDFRPIVVAAILIMLYTPFFLLYQGSEVFIMKNREAAEETNVKMNTFIGKTSRRNNGFKQVIKGIGDTFKNVKFLIGFLVITTMLLVSVVYTMTADPLVEKVMHIYEDGKIVSAAPHEPKYVFLGTDVLGYRIWDQLLAGAKYTILFALSIAFLRVALGFLLAVPYAFFLPSKLQKGMSKVVDGMYFLPLTIIAYILVSPVLMMPMGGFETTEMERILYQGIILTLLVVPLLVILFGNEMKGLMREEFVMSTKVLGGSSIHLLRRHLMPHLSARIGIVFGQQFIQTLLILIHLGVFNLYFGGTKTSFDPLLADPPRSTTYEWSGLIGASKDALMTGRWWYIFPPLIAFMILIFSMQLMIRGLKEVQQRRVGVAVERSSWWKNWFTNKRSSPIEKKPVKREAFVFTHHEDSWYHQERKKG